MPILAFIKSSDARHATYVARHVACRVKMAAT